MCFKLFSLFFIGITDDDLGETAYEVLLACAGASGYTILSSVFPFLFFSLFFFLEYFGNNFLGYWSLLVLTLGN